MRKQELIERLILRAYRILRNSKEFRMDVESYNFSHPKSPMEVDPDGELANAEAYAQAILDRFIRGEG